MCVLINTSPLNQKYGKVKRRLVHEVKIRARTICEFEKKIKFDNTDR